MAESALSSRKFLLMSCNWLVKVGDAIVPASASTTSSRDVPMGEVGMKRGLFSIGHTCDGRLVGDDSERNCRTSLENRCTSCPAGT